MYNDQQLAAGTAAPPCSVPHIAKVFATFERLEECRRVMKRLLGSEWSEKTKLYREKLTAESARTGRSILEVAIVLGTAMKRDGHDPIMLLAVAADMEDSPNNRSSVPPPVAGGG